MNHDFWNFSHSLLVRLLSLFFGINDYLVIASLSEAIDEAVSTQIRGLLPRALRPPRNDIMAQVSSSALRNPHHTRLNLKT